MISKRMLGVFGAGAVAALAAASAAGAFTQLTPLTACGHECITREGGHLAGGWFNEPHQNEVTGERADCRIGCSQFGTNNWKTWSAAIGQRWVDIGGYSAIFDATCFWSAIQDSEEVQYSHAIRQTCDAGLEGLKRTYNGTVAIIEDRFLRATSVADGPMFAADGGAVVFHYKVSRPEFFLGLALHPLQDSFTTEHSIRSPDWHTIIDLKTYVATRMRAGVSPGDFFHAKAELSDFAGSLTSANQPSVTQAQYNAIFNDRFTWKLHRVPNGSHGDHPWTSGDEGNIGRMKAAAQAASHATADLMKAFEAARLSGLTNTARHKQLFEQFKNTWLRFAPLPDNTTNAPGCKPVPNPADCGGNGDCESARLTCLHRDGIETQLPRVVVNGHVAAGDYPKFCRGGQCQDTGFDKVQNATVRAGQAVGHALSDMGSFFAHIAQSVEDFFSHFWHSYDRCYNESGDFGRRGGDKYMISAHNKGDQFWNELGTAIDELTLAERHQAVDANWAKVKAGILQQEQGVRNATCGRVRGWFTKGSSKDNAENWCRNQVDGHVRGLSAQLDGIYNMHMNKGLPAPHVAAHVAASARPVHMAAAQHGVVELALTHDHDANIQVVESHAKAELASCKTRLVNVHFQTHSGADTCEHAYRARMAAVGKPMPAPPGETPDQKRDRFYNELHTCMLDPLGRFHHFGRMEKICKDRYAAEMAAAGLHARNPADEPQGHGPHVEK